MDKKDERNELKEWGELNAMVPRDGKGKDTST